MAAQRHAVRICAVRDSQRNPLRSRSSVQPVDELRGCHAAFDPAYDRHRHRALPADGRRCHFPPRLRLYAGDALRARRVLRDRVLAGQPGAEEFQGPREYRSHHGHADRHVPVPAAP